MRVARSGLTVLFAALAVLCTGLSDAQAQTFRFRVCNQSNVTASVAISNYVAAGDSRFVVQGWWTVGAGNCEWIGYFPKGWFYVYAEQTGTQSVVWEGNDVKLCIRHPGPWERINATGYNCRSDEVLRGFAAEFIANDAGTYTVTLN
jgi:uncharacterized membrane protein